MIIFAETFTHMKNFSNFLGIVRELTAFSFLTIFPFTILFPLGAEPASFREEDIIAYENTPLWVLFLPFFVTGGTLALIFFYQHFFITNKNK